jgi:periplasmic divalent cation tolerance protein
MDDLAVVLVTTESAEQGDRVAQALLNEHLAACVNCVPTVTSHYWWQGKIEHARETLLIIKTRSGLVPQVVAAVKAAHSYTVPEVIALPILGGNPDYLAWVRTEAGG